MFSRSFSRSNSLQSCWCCNSIPRLLRHPCPCKKSPEGIADHKNAAELPDYLYQIVRCYMPSRCILTALELDIFTAIGGGAAAAQLASKIGTNTLGVSTSG